MYYEITEAPYDYLEHHGIKGQKWGVRRFQNEDGTLTPAGERRYNRDTKRLDKLQSKAIKAKNKKLESISKYEKKFNSVLYGKKTLERTKEKVRVKDIKAARKANKAINKYNNIIERYKNTSISALNESQIKIGEQLINDRLNRMEEIATKIRQY